jgi:hypothetical protein
MFPAEFVSTTILNWRPKMKIFPGLQGKKRALVFFIVGLVALLMSGFSFYLTRDILSMVLSIALLAFTLWYGYKAFAGDE